MPVDYQCHDCGLQFSVGHLKMPQRAEYRSAVYLVCRACGVWHLALHSVRGDALLAQPKPQVKRPKASRSPMIPSDQWIPVGQSRAAGRKMGAITHSLRTLVGIRPRYHSLYCGHCHRLGTLVSSVRGTTCPHCKKQRLEEWLSYVS